MTVLTTWPQSLLATLVAAPARIAAALRKIEDSLDEFPQDYKFTDSVERELCERESRRLFR